MCFEKVPAGKPFPQRSSSEITGLKPDIDLPPMGSRDAHLNSQLLILDNLP